MGIYIYIYHYAFFRGIWWVLMIYRFCMPLMDTDDIQGRKLFGDFLLGEVLGSPCQNGKETIPLKKNVVRCPMVSWVSLLWIESSIDLSFFTPPINRPIFNGSPWGNQMYQRMGILITGLYPAIIEWGCNWRYMGCLLKWMICDMWDQNGRHDFFTTNNWEIIGICITSFSVVYGIRSIWWVTMVINYGWQF